MRRVELDVLGTEPHQLFDLLAQDLRHVFQKEIERRIGTGGQLWRPEVRVHARTRQRDLHGPLRAAPRVNELLDREVAPPPQLSDNAEGLWTFGRLLPHLLATVPLAPQPGVYVVFAEAIYRLYQLALERLPAHLTVSDHGEPCPLLQPDSPVYSPILDTFEPGCGEGACCVAFARLQQFRRSQETAYDVCPGTNDLLHTGQSSTRPSLGKPRLLSRFRPLLRHPVQRRN